MPDTANQCSSEATMELSADYSVELLVRRLNGLCRKATLEFALKVGQLVIETIYSGDLSKWRIRDSTKERSLRKLVRHPDFPMSPPALYRSIALYELCQRIDIGQWSHISSSHLRLVLPLPEGEQIRLLHMAEVDRWPVRRLDEEVATVLQEKPSHCDAGGRRRQSRVRRAARLVAKAIDELVGSRKSKRSCAIKRAKRST